MCGRFSLVADPDDLREAFPWLNIPTTEMAPRYNIAPSQPVAVIPNDGLHRLDFFSWGLIPSWAKDPSIGNRMINARAETLSEKPSFLAAFRRRRCLIPADGFYEWKAEPGKKTKTPMYIHMKSGGPFAFAGLWESWNSPDGSNIRSCSIVTTTPNALMQKIHNRMPVILPSSSYDLWLEPAEVDPKKLGSLLQPYPEEEMTAYPVSTLVNNPANDMAACIEPLETRF
jgi:putative SOS response-associated peptidase YedK